MARVSCDMTLRKYRRFNDWLRGRMRREKVSQVRLAEYLGVNQQTLSKRLDGQIEWSFRDVLEVLEYFNTDFEEIM